MKRWLTVFLLMGALSLASRAQAFTISGHVTGGQAQFTMLKYVVAIPLRLDTALHFAIVIPLINTYSISNLDSGSYIIFAYQNVTSNPIPIPALEDPRGFYGGPVPQIFGLMGDSSGVDIALSAPNTAGYSGRISYSGHNSGTTYIVSSYQRDFYSTHGGGVLLGSLTAGQVFNTTGNGTYTALADSFTTYYVKAFMDLNNNFTEDEGEPVGFFGGDTARQITISPTSFPDSVNIVMRDPSAVDPEPLTVARELALGGAYPNPFNSETVIPFALKNSGDLTLRVYDVTGRMVKTLASGHYGAGSYAVHFSAGDLASGLYMVRLESAGQTMTNRVVLIR
jgi:hypothetical protein